MQCICLNTVSSTMAVCQGWHASLNVTKYYALWAQLCF